MSIGGILSGASNSYPQAQAASTKGAQDVTAVSTKLSIAGQSQVSSAPSESVVVTMSDAAKAALAGVDNSSAKQGGTLRERLDAQYAAAKAEGTFITNDSAKGGRWLDMSSFTDEELAQIRLDRSGEFSEDESNFAWAKLGARMTVSLREVEPNPVLGDRRAMMMGIKALYSQMSDDVRAALGWTPAMMISTDNQLNIDSEKHGWLSIDSLLPKLLDASDNGGLRFMRDKLNLLPHMGPDRA